MTAGHGTGARALYLDGGASWRVKLDDGVALHISAPGRARGLYPLRRLARVLSPARAEWTTEALLACLQAGVPVLFHDARGEPVGWCFGPRRRETTLAVLLREGLTQPDWDARFASWRQAAERRAALHALRTAQAGAQRLDAAAARAQLCNAHRRRLGWRIGPHLHALQGAAAALVSERLQQAIGDATLVNYPRPGLHLGAEFTALLEWPLHRLLWRTPMAELAAAAPGPFAAAAMERHAPLLHRELGELLGDLELFLREWLG